MVVKPRSLSASSPRSGEVFQAGRPGGYASLLAAKARLKITAWALLLLGSFWVLSKSYPDLTTPFPGPLLPGLAAITITVAAACIRLYQGVAAAAAVGARSERIVARSLVKLRPLALLHSVDLDAGGDADHLVIGPKLVSVETKTGSGVVRYEDGKLYVGHKALKGDPVAQCRRQALAAKQVFSTFCDAVVCVVDMSNSPFTVSSVTVCSVQDLPSVLHGFPDRLSANTAMHHAQVLASRCSTIHDKNLDSSRGKNPSKVEKTNRNNQNAATGDKNSPQHSAPNRPTDPGSRARTLNQNPPRQAGPVSNPSSPQRPLRKLSPRRSSS